MGLTREHLGVALGVGLVVCVVALALSYVQFNLGVGRGRAEAATPGRCQDAVSAAPTQLSPVFTCPHPGQRPEPFGAFGGHILCRCAQ